MQHTVRQSSQSHYHDEFIENHLTAYMLQLRRWYLLGEHMFILKLRNFMSSMFERESTNHNDCRFALLVDILDGAIGSALGC